MIHRQKSKKTPPSAHRNAPNVSKSLRPPQNFPPKAQDVHPQMFSNWVRARREQQTPQEFHPEEIPASEFRADPAPSLAQPFQTQSPQSHETHADQCRRRSHQQKSANRAGPVSAAVP